MELVTGRAGSPHITSQQDRQKHQGIWGDGAYILATGNRLEPQVQSSNKILIKDGALMFQGALFSVKVGTTDEITINNGNQGMQRKDLVVARYTYDSSQQKESAEWVVIQGEPAASNPVAPSGTSGDIQTGDTTVDCPFMIVNLNGINVTGVDIIPEVALGIPTINASLSELTNNLSFLKHKTVKNGPYEFDCYTYMLNGKKVATIHGSWTGTSSQSSIVGGFSVYTINNLRLSPDDAELDIQKHVSVDFNPGTGGGGTLFIGNYEGLSAAMGANGHRSQISALYCIVTSPPRAVKITWTLKCELYS